ncbi:MAG: integrase core domain-containing protein [Trueperaceae bacterium]|nr:integrase core domain-containing protein [Trueperaceae bacterium]
MERSQQTDLRESRPTVDLRTRDLGMQLEYWQFHYNWHRPHGALGGKTPIDRCAKPSDITPPHEYLDHLYDPSQEQPRIRDSAADTTAGKLKRTL